jgi:hypothetical protein
MKERNRSEKPFEDKINYIAFVIRLENNNSRYHVLLKSGEDLLEYRQCFKINFATEVS